MNSYDSSHDPNLLQKKVHFQSLVVCPICKKSLSFDRNFILCNGCDLNFPQLSEDWINLFPNHLLQEEEQWSLRQKEMEDWYKDFIAVPSEASASLLSDYTPFTHDLASLHGKILDIGGGVGLVRHYLPPDAEYTVLDPSLDWLNVEWKKLANVFPCLSVPPAFVRGVGEYLPFPDNCFSAVLSFWSANHASDPQKVFEEAHRVLSPGGILLAVLEDMEPLFRDFFDRSFPSEEVLQGFFHPTEISLDHARLKLFSQFLSGQNFPLQSDHIRIKESDIHKWTKGKLSITSRRWVNQFLTFKFKKKEV